MLQRLPHGRFFGVFYFVDGVSRYWLRGVQIDEPLRGRAISTVTAAGFYRASHAGNLRCGPHVLRQVGFAGWHPSTNCSKRVVRSPSMMPARLCSIRLAGFGTVGPLMLVVRGAYRQPHTLVRASADIFLLTGPLRPRQNGEEWRIFHLRGTVTRKLYTQV